MPWDIRRFLNVDMGISTSIACANMVCRYLHGTVPSSPLLLNNSQPTPSPLVDALDGAIGHLDKQTLSCSGHYKPTHYRIISTVTCE